MSGLVKSAFNFARFNDHVAIVTGGSRGIGLGIAKRIGKEGGKIALIDRDEPQLNLAVDMLKKDNISCFGITSDVTSDDHVNKAVKAVIGRWGKVDILVNCAGITGHTNLKTHMVELEDFHKVMDVNLNGTFYFSRAVLPHMMKNNYGRIVNIASVAGKEGNAGMLAYSTSKAAVIGLTKVIGKEYAETNITCNAVAPGVVLTPMVEALPPEQIKYMTDKIPMKRTGSIDEIAALVSFIASKEASFTTGFVFDATGGRSTY